MEVNNVFGIIPEGKAEVEATKAAIKGVSSFLKIVFKCTPDGHDDSNMNFVDLLRRMSSVEAKVIDYACRNCKKIIHPNKLITAVVE